MPQPSENPFVPDRPITEEERFFGREDVIEWVDDRLFADQRFVLIYGTPRMGKTSLLFRLRPRLAGKTVSVYLDLAAFSQTTLRELLWGMIEEVHRQLYQERPGAPVLSHETYLVQSDYLHETVFPLWRQGLGRKGLALLLDGLDLGRLKEGAWAELVLRWREVVAQESDLFLVAALNGTAHETKDPVAALRGLPYRELDPLRLDQVEELLLGEARYQMGFDYDALRRVYTWTGGHPYLVQVFGAELYRRLAPLGQVTMHVVGEVMPVVLGVTERLFARQWEALSREEQIVLAAAGSIQGNRGPLTPWDVVLVLRRAGVTRTIGAAEQVLRDICNRGLMHWFGGSAYSLRGELWRPWIAKYHPLPEVLHGRRWRKRETVGSSGRRLAIDWGTILLWVGFGLAILLVLRVWNTRGSRLARATPEPTPTTEVAALRPTPTRVPLPGRIAHQSRGTNQEQWSIWIMRDDGSDPQRLTDGSTEDMMPAWSPDGKRLAFISNRSGNRDVWVMNADGSHLENVSRSGADEWTPAWSPDGSEIAFASNRDGNWELYIAKSDGTQVRRITWSPGADYAPTWATDGARLAFVSERDGNPEIYVVHRDGSSPLRLTKNQATDMAPSWSPDGKLIAFETYRDGNMEIYVMAPDGSEPRNISNEPQSDEHGPSWSPDSKRLVYYSNRDGNWDIFAMRADGTQKANLTKSTGIEQGAVWQPPVQP